MSAVAIGMYLSERVTTGRHEAIRAVRAEQRQLVHELPMPPAK